VIKPTTKTSVYSSNDDAISALKAKQIDALVVDLPTAFYVTARRSRTPRQRAREHRRPVPSPGRGDREHFSAVLAKAARSPRASTGDRGDEGGRSLDQITKEWL